MLADGAWKATFAPDAVDSEDVEVRERVSRSTIGWRLVGFNGTTGSSSSSELYWESGTMTRGSSRSSDTECCTSARDMGFLVRESDAAVRRRFGGGLFSFSWESFALRFSGLIAGIETLGTVCESGIDTFSSFSRNSSNCD